MFEFIRKITVLFRLCVSRRYRLIRKTNLFDSCYYQHSIAPDVSAADILWHYIQKTGSGCLTGTGQLPEPHPLFDSAFYCAKYLRHHHRVHPFVHYLHRGWKKGHWPSPFLDPETYRTRSDWMESAGNALSHYNSSGRFSFVSPSPFFDVQWYLDKTPILREAGTEIIRHYKMFGAREGKSPIPVFDPGFYLSQLERHQNPHDPLCHYVTHADSSKLRPSPWFDPDYYRQHCSDEVSRSMTLAHYLSRGVYEGRYTDARVATLAHKPLFSILVPVYNPNIHFLNTCIRSVLYQVYPHWELCLADDGSTDPRVRELLAGWTRRDKRIKVTYHSENKGISAATNSAAVQASGDYLGFLDNDDEISPDCLYQLAEAIQRTGAEVLYTDEDLIGDDGSRLSIFRKPSYNPELLLSHNYVTHFVAVAKKRFEQAGGLLPRYDGAQDYDLMLRLAAQNTSFHHIPLILYHWRAAATSTSIDHGQKSYAHEAGRHALEQALESRAIPAEIRDTDLNFFYRIDFPVPQQRKIAVLIWLGQESKDEILQVSRMLERTSCNDARFVIVFSSDQQKAALPEVPDSSTPRCSLYCTPGLEKAQALQQAAMGLDTEYLVFLDTAATAVEPDWLEQLQGPFACPATAITCGRVMFADTDGLSYLLPDMQNESDDYYCSFITWSSRHMNGLHCLQQIACCGWEAAMLKKSAFANAGGFAYELFPQVFAMADLCLRLSAEGNRIIYTPHAIIRRDLPAISNKHQKFSRHRRAEKACFQAKWRQVLPSFDPFYNHAVLDDHGIARQEFLAWLTGLPGERIT